MQIYVVRALRLIEEILGSPCLKKKIVLTITPQSFDRDLFT